METQGKLNVEFPDLELLQRFDVPGPRYTSYPTADRFTKEFGAEGSGLVTFVVSPVNISE